MGRGGGGRRGKGEGIREASSVPDGRGYPFLLSRPFAIPPAPQAGDARAAGAAASSVG